MPTLKNLERVTVVSAYKIKIFYNCLCYLKIHLVE